MGGKGCRGSRPPARCPGPCAPCQQPGNATATRDSLARAGVPKEGSFGAREAEPAGESHAAGVRFPAAPWCPCVSDRARLAGALDLRLPVSQGKPPWGQGPVRIRAVPVPARPQPAASPSAAERSWVPPCQAVLVGPDATNWGVKGCVSCCRGDSPTGNGNAVLGVEPGAQTRMGAPVLAVLGGQHRAGVRTWTELSWRCQGGADVMGRLCITRTAGSHTHPVRRGGPRCPEAAGASPCASRSLLQGWQGCAAGHGRRRTPAPLSDFAG